MLGVPLLAVLLHQVGQVGSHLFRALVLPEVAQRIHADHRITCFVHGLSRETIDVAPAAVTGVEDGHYVGVAGLDVRIGRHLDGGDIVVLAQQPGLELLAQYHRQGGAIVGDGQIGIALLAHEDGGVISGMIVPGDMPVAVRGLGRQCIRAIQGFHVEADAQGRSLGVVLGGQPAPCPGRAWADTADEGWSTAQFLGRSGEIVTLGLAAVEHLDFVLNDLGAGVGCQAQQVGIRQLQIGRGRQHDAGMRLTLGRGHGQQTAVRLRQDLDLGSRWPAMKPPPAQARGDQQKDEQYDECTFQHRTLNV